MDNIEVLIDEDTLQLRIKQLAKQISSDYKGKDLTVICILKGAMYFFADLTRRLDLNVNIDFMRLSSYEGENSTGKVNIKLDVENSIKGKDVLIVEDIIDSGRSMEFLFDYLSLKDPNSIKLCVLLDKPERRIVNVNADYVGFTIPNRFVIGYGLDLDEMYRNTPQINCVTDDLVTLEKDVKNLKKQIEKK